MNYPYQESIEAEGSAHINNVRIDLGSPTLITIIALAGIIGACGLVMGLNLAKQSRIDNDVQDMKLAWKLEERRKMDLEAYMMLQGWKIPSDDTHGPTGNFDRMKPKEK